MYGIAFYKIDCEKNEMKQLLAFNIGETENAANAVFDKIEHNYNENKREPEIVIDLIGNDWTILRDYALTYYDAKELAASMGWDIDTDQLISA